MARDQPVARPLKCLKTGLQIAFFLDSGHAPPHLATPMGATL